MLRLRLLRLRSAKVCGQSFLIRVYPRLSAFICVHASTSLLRLRSLRLRSVQALRLRSARAAQAPGSTSLWLPFFLHLFFIFHYSFRLWRHGRWSWLLLSSVYGNFKAATITPDIIIREPIIHRVCARISFWQSVLFSELLSNSSDLASAICFSSSALTLAIS